MENESKGKEEGSDKRKITEDDEHLHKKVCTEENNLTFETQKNNLGDVNEKKDETLVRKQSSPNVSENISKGSKSFVTESQYSVEPLSLDRDEEFPTSSVSNSQLPAESSPSLNDPTSSENVSSINITSYMCSNNDSQDKISEITESEITSLLERDSEALLDKSQEQSLGLGLSELAMTVESPMMDTIDAQITPSDEKLLDTDDSVSNLMENIISIVESKDHNIGSKSESSVMSKVLPDLDAQIVSSSNNEMIYKDEEKKETAILPSVLKDTLPSLDAENLKSIDSKNPGTEDQNISDSHSGNDFMLTREVKNLPFASTVPALSGGGCEGKETENLLVTKGSEDKEVINPLLRTINSEEKSDSVLGTSNSKKKEQVNPLLGTNISEEKNVNPLLSDDIAQEKEFQSPLLSTTQSEEKASKNSLLKTINSENMNAEGLVSDTSNSEVKEAAVGANSNNEKDVEHLLSDKANIHSEATEKEELLSSNSKFEEEKVDSLLNTDVSEEQKTDTQLISTNNLKEKEASIENSEKKEAEKLFSTSEEGKVESSLLNNSNISKEVEVEDLIPIASNSEETTLSLNTSTSENKESENIISSTSKSNEKEADAFVINTSSSEHKEVGNLSVITSNSEGKEVENPSVITSNSEGKEVKNSLSNSSKYEGKIEETPSLNTSTLDIKEVENLSSTNEYKEEEDGSTLLSTSHSDSKKAENLLSTNRSEKNKPENLLNPSNLENVESHTENSEEKIDDTLPSKMSPDHEEVKNKSDTSSFLVPEQIDSVLSSRSEVLSIKEIKAPISENLNVNKKESLLEYDKVDSQVSSSKGNLTFEGTLKKITLESSGSVPLEDFGSVVTTTQIGGDSHQIKPTSSFEPICDSIGGSLITEGEIEQDKKSEISGMEIDSVNHTPVEGSIVDTPDSGETSPSTSTPADSCQVSAAPSPLLKEDTNIASESLMYDESSMDTKDIPDDVVDEKEEIAKPARMMRKRGRRGTPKYKKRKGKQPVVVDEETRMSANGVSDLGMDEDSQSSTGMSSKKEPRRFRGEIIVPESTETFTAEKVTEYVWPLDVGEHYFIQEQVSQYLGIMSFKRKYPDLRRRPIESQEKEFLKEQGLVTEIACDLGLTAVRSEDVLDIMYNDFPAKYEELQRVLRESKEKQLKEKSKVDYQVLNLDKSKMQEYSRKAALNAFKWNINFNRERHEERRYSFDLQTFTYHVPNARGVKLNSCATKMGSYPVAVLPGQYTDYCKRYSTEELKSMPLQTVLLGPFTAEELASEVQEDSDEESAAASLGTCPDIKEEQPDVPPVVDPLSAEKQPRCKVCNGGRARNKDGKPEPLIICGTCRTASHPTCIDLTLVMIDKIESYSWQCMDCKTCAQCNDPDDEEKMIFCDMCDRGYHIYCVGLRKVPNGRWHCKECAACFTCGARNPAGSEHVKNAEWQHEFKKDKHNKQLKYVCTLCVPCDKYWKRRQFCTICLKVYRSIPEDGMVRCTVCPKYVHKEGCSLIHENERFCNNCFKSRNNVALNHSRIIAAAKKKMAASTIWK